MIKLISQKFSAFMQQRQIGIKNMIKLISIVLIPFSPFFAKILFKKYGELFGNMASDKNIVLVSFNVASLVATVLFCYFQNLENSKIDE